MHFAGLNVIVHLFKLYIRSFSYITPTSFPYEDFRSESNNNMFNNYGMDGDVFTMTGEETCVLVIKEIIFSRYM